MKTEDEQKQKELAQKSNKILEEIIEIEPDAKLEFNLGFAKVSRSIKKIKR